MSSGSTEPGMIDLPVNELMEHVTSLESSAEAVERELNKERSVALGAVLYHLSLIRRGYAEPDVQDELLGLASNLVNELGLTAAIAVMDIKEGPGEIVSDEGIQDLASQLKSRRLELGLSQEEFGKRFGVSRFTVLRAEKGRDKPVTLRFARVVLP